MDQAAEDRVVAFGGDSGAVPGALLERLRAPNGGFFTLVIPDPSITEPWKLGITGLGVRCAVIDTGVLLEHPVIAAALDGAVDVTGSQEGPSDENGHGTAVALVLLATAPDQRLFSIKALDQRAGGRPEWLIAALERAAVEEVDLINLSAGVYRAYCAGDCDVCTAALAITGQVRAIAVASGNRPDITACPAKGLVLHRRGFAVEAFDFEEDMRMPESGVGNVGGVIYRYRIVPIVGEN